MLYYVIATFGLIGLVIVLMVWPIYRRTTDMYRFSQARGSQLVEYLEWIFCRKGYVLTEVRYIAEYQIETVLTKNSVVTMVQIWHRKGKVTKTMVEFLYSIALKEDCDWAMIISIAGFSKDANKTARKLGITLHDRHWVKKALRGCRLKFKISK